MAATKKKVDFRGVKDRSGFKIRHYPEGDYRARIVDVDDHTSKEDNEGWVWTIQIKGGKFPYYTMLDKKQLWKVRNLFIAAGLTVPKKLLAVDPNKAIGKDIGVTLEDDEYEGRLKSVIADTFPLSELVDGEDEDDEEEVEDVEEEDDENEDVEEEEPKKKKKKSKKKAKDEDDDDDEEDLEELEIDDL